MPGEVEAEAEEGDVLVHATDLQLRETSPRARRGAEEAEGSSSGPSRASSGPSRASSVEVEVEVLNLQPPAPAAPAEAPAAAPRAASPAKPPAATTPAPADWRPVDWDAPAGLIKAGSTSAHLPKGTFGLGDGTAFKLRVGPDYKRNGRKAPSMPNIYQAATIDFFKVEKIVLGITERLSLPPPPDSPPGAPPTPNHTGLPRRLIINCMVPAEAPSLLATTVDGPCYQVVVVLTATAEQLAAYQAERSAASRLFETFCAEAPNGLLPTTGNLNIKERVKLMALVGNLKELGLGLLERFNAKPVIISQSGVLARGDDWLEIGINMYRWAYAPKKVFANLLHTKMGKLQLHISLTLEGRADEELPERAMGAVSIAGMDLPRISVPLK